MTPTQFNKVVGEFVKKMPDDLINKATRKLAFDILAGVVKKTPVDTGRARGNWQLSLGKPVEDEVSNAEQRDPRNDAATVMAAYRPFQTVWLCNNVPYIKALEEGSSGQAPTGMLAVTLQEIATKISD